MKIILEKEKFHDQVPIIGAAEGSESAEEVAAVVVVVVVVVDVVVVGAKPKDITSRKLSG